MQSWHDQGYFTPDLLMKRTQIDADWISVRDLSQRAVGPKIFLSPVVAPVPPGPPGLTRRPDNLSDQLLNQREPSPFSAPHQPVPIRSLRTSALDSYINGNSQSASPSSSAGPMNNIFGNPETCRASGKPTAASCRHKAGKYGNRVLHHHRGSYRCS